MKFVDDDDDEQECGEIEFDSASDRQSLYFPQNWCYQPGPKFADIVLRFILRCVIRSS